MLSGSFSLYAPTARLLRQQWMSVRIWNDIVENREKERRKLLSGEVQTPHTGDCSTVADTRGMWGDSIVEFLLLVVGWSCYVFCRRIVDYSTNRVNKARLR